MYVVTIVAAIAVTLIAVFFIAVIVGARQEHPTELAELRPTRLAAIAARVHGLHVRRDVPGEQPALHARRDRVTR